MGLKIGDRVLLIYRDKSPRWSGKIIEFSDGGEYANVRSDTSHLTAWEAIENIRPLDGKAIEDAIKKPAPAPWTRVVLDRIFGKVEAKDGAKAVDGANGEAAPPA